jgi:hypothetical protein
MVMKLNNKELKKYLETAPKITAADIKTHIPSYWRSLKSKKNMAWVYQIAKNKRACANSRGSDEDTEMLFVNIYRALSQEFIEENIYDLDIGYVSTFCLYPEYRFSDKVLERFFNSKDSDNWICNEIAEDHFPSLQFCFRYIDHLWEHFRRIMYRESVVGYEIYERYKGYEKDLAGIIFARTEAELLE